VVFFICVIVAGGFIKVKNYLLGTTFQLRDQTDLRKSLAASVASLLVRNLIPRVQELQVLSLRLSTRHFIFVFIVVGSY
jgi:hypothetical protein